MNESFPNPVPVPPRRQDARDLQSRLYREIGLAAVEAALFASDVLLAEIDRRHRPAENPVIVAFPRNAA